MHTVGFNGRLSSSGCPRGCGRAAAPARCHRTHARCNATPGSSSTAVAPCPDDNAPSCSGRRGAVFGLLAASAALVVAPARPAFAAVVNAAEVEAEAYAAYADRKFTEAVRLLDTIAAPDDPRWLEMRAQVLVDGKDFEGALTNYTQALKICESTGAPLTTRARLLSGRGLALEGLSRWSDALSDYDSALRFASDGGESLDPYVLNARGNVLNSLGEWQRARDDYLAAADIFQASRGYRGRNGTTTARLDGAIFSASNAALMLAELGDTEGAEAELKRIRRRAPGSADARVALAALLWRRGDEASAESEFEYACDSVSVGCRKYLDSDWVSRIRRWPPTMCAALGDFLRLQRGAGAGAAG